MVINTKQMVSMTEANQNFSKVVKIADQYGETVVLKNNKPRYLIVDLQHEDYFELSDDEKIEVAAKRILAKHINAFKELAK